MNTPNERQTEHTKEPSHNWCALQHPDGWACSGTKGHVGWHIAQSELNGPVLFAWPPDALVQVSDPAAALRAAREAMERAIPLLEVLHSLMKAKDTRASVYRRIEQARAALAALPAPGANTEGTR